jgi:hypothetical protein
MAGTSPGMTAAILLAFAFGCALIRNESKIAEFEK